MTKVAPSLSRFRSLVTTIRRPPIQSTRIFGVIHHCAPIREEKSHDGGRHGELQSGKIVLPDLSRSVRVLGVLTRLHPAWGQVSGL